MSRWVLSQENCFAIEGYTPKQGDRTIVGVNAETGNLIRVTEEIVEKNGFSISTQVRVDIPLDDVKAYLEGLGEVLPRDIKASLRPSSGSPEIIIEKQ